MRPVLSAEQMRAFDRHFLDAGVSGSILMENAGRGAAHLIGLKLRPRHAAEAARTGSSVVGSCVRCADERSLKGAQVLILAGAGNNGGDGFVVARHLAARAAQVTVLLTSPVSEIKGDARLAWTAMHAVGVKSLPAFENDFAQLIEDSDLVVDALLGTGAQREITGQLAQLIEKLNGANKLVIALDVPSGLDATRGNILNVAVRAQHTVTFAHLKAGLLTTFGHQCSGNITLANIGVPAALPASIDVMAFLLEESDARARLRQRSPTTHKVESGRVIVVAGSPGTLGAARLAARAALRAGAGHVTVVNTPATIALLDSEAMEIMTHAFGASGPCAPEVQLFSQADVLIVGPGLGTSPEAVAAIDLAFQASCPVIVDADALRYLAEEGQEVWDHFRPGDRAILTPHPGEAAALLGVTSGEVEQDRFGSAKKLAERYGATVLLKGSRPILCAPNRLPVVSAFGSAALGTAGSGDVFCGILAAQLVGASSLALIFDALIVAVALQGQAAELWSEKNGDRGLLASEVGDLVPQVIARWLGQ